MIAEKCDTAIKDKNVYLRLPTKEEAKQFYDDLKPGFGSTSTNKSLEDRIITFTFGSEEDAKNFHIAMIKQFGDRNDPEVQKVLKDEPTKNF
jgi:hypothetical protein